MLMFLEEGIACGGKANYLICGWVSLECTNEKPEFVLKKGESAKPARSALFSSVVNLPVRSSVSMLCETV